MSFDDRGAIFLCDAFEEEGAFWLVPKWLHYSEAVKKLLAGDRQSIMNMRS